MRCTLLTAEEVHKLMTGLGVVSCQCERLREEGERPHSPHVVPELRAVIAVRGVAGRVALSGQGTCQPCSSAAKPARKNLLRVDEVRAVEETEVSTMEERRRVGGCAATHNLAGSRRKKTGVLLKTQSMFCVAHCQHGSVDDDAVDTGHSLPPRS